MNTIFWSALGIGGATLIGSALGFVFREWATRYSGIILSLSAGVMLAAAISGLIEPAMESNGVSGIILSTVGIFLGAVTLFAIEALIPVGSVGDAKGAVLFAIAIAIHNLPEGIAAGIGFGAGDTEAAISVAVGIALHNLPEGMIVVAPLMASRLGFLKTLLLATAGGVAEVLGTFLGYFAARVSTLLLPLALSFAGGTMLYAIASEMIPEAQAHGKRRASFALILGFTAMAAVSVLIN